MIGEILKIKTSIPPLGPNILPRPRVLQALEDNLVVPEGFARQLTLVSAPAGFGKTTMLRSWLSGREQQTAWYSLDEGDNEPERFWIYLISALQTLDNSVGKSALEILNLSALTLEPDSRNRSFLTSLLNDLFTMNSSFFLVIDDYHLISNPRIHEDMSFFIESLPPTIHLAVTTRSDPPWPSTRWRARGNMFEVRMDELKFSEDEAEDFFARSKVPELNSVQLDTLYEKTEGWPTALQLAASSLAASRNADDFIGSFTGNHRHILHFLSEEVISSQTDDVRSFLLETSILNRFCSSLCDAITGRDDSAEILAALERENVFIIAMDNEGFWYRYHSLFSDLLNHQLKTKSPEKITVLQERAVAWFLLAGEFGEALRHSALNKNYETMARILHDHYEEILKKEGPKQINEALKNLPDDLLVKYPRLTIQKALFTIIFKGIEEAGHYIKLASELRYDRQEDQREFAGLLAAIKTCHKVYCNDFPTALKCADEALELLPEQNIWRINVAIYSGDIRLFSENPKDAHPFYLKAYNGTEAFNNQYLSITSGFKVATSLLFLGRFVEAEKLTEDILQNAKNKGMAKLPRIGLLWVLLGELMREKGDLAEAERCIERGLILSDTEKPSLGWNRLFKIALAYSQRDYDKAYKTIAEIEADMLQFNLPHFITFPAAVWKTRLLLENGDFSSVRNILEGYGITAESSFKPGLEKGYLMLARLLIKENKTDRLKNGQLLEQIIEQAESRENLKVYLEALHLSAVLKEMTDSPAEAEKQLDKALLTGRTAGYYQLFYDESREWLHYISAITSRLKKNNPAAIRMLPDFPTAISPTEMAGNNGGEDAEITATGASVTAATTPASAISSEQQKKRSSGSHHYLVEDLSVRELEILDLISQGLSNQDIADKLFLSLGTVKWHNSNIYGKLGVRGRTHAVSQARELELLS